jgi:very-short-patch-repair endonuclease
MANEIARRLRKTMTPQEVKLWVHLRALKDQGLHFRRQVPREGYIVDFACLKSKLVIEIDGAQHGEPTGLRQDAERDVRLSAGSFGVLRFWNNEVNENLAGVVERSIARQWRGTPPVSLREPPSPLPGRDILPLQGKVAAARSGADGWGVESLLARRRT